MSLMQLDNLSFLTYGAIGLTGVILAVATAYDKDDEESGYVEPEKEQTVMQTVASAVGLDSSTAPQGAASNNGNTPAAEPTPATPSNTEPQNTGVFGGKQKRNKNKAKKTKRKRGGGKKARKTKHRPHPKLEQ
jgi:hypothetical protein